MAKNQKYKAKIYLQTGGTSEVEVSASDFNSAKTLIKEIYNPRLISGVFPVKEQPGYSNSVDRDKSSITPLPSGISLIIIIILAVIWGASVVYDDVKHVYYQSKGLNY